LNKWEPVEMRDKQSEVYDRNQAGDPKYRCTRKKKKKESAKHEEHLGQKNDLRTVLWEGGPQKQPGKKKKI